MQIPGHQHASLMSLFGNSFCGFISLFISAYNWIRKDTSFSYKQNFADRRVSIDMSS